MVDGITFVPFLFTKLSTGPLQKVFWRGDLSDQVSSPSNVPSFGSDVILRGFCTNVTEYFDGPSQVPSFGSDAILRGFCTNVTEYLGAPWKSRVLVQTWSLGVSVPTWLSILGTTLEFLVSSTNVILMVFVPDVTEHSKEWLKLQFFWVDAIFIGLCPE